MADWRQIQARIRKAKTSSDPPAQLAELFQRTRDAMVAFELAQWHEKAGNAGETVQWYTTAAQRFRRAQWRTKAEEALTRLGAPIPEQVPLTEHAHEAGGAALHAASSAASGSADAAESVHDESGAYPSSVESEAEAPHAGNGRQPMVAGDAESAEESAQASAPGGAAAAAGKRRRRGRRGGRKRRGRGGAGEQAAAGPPTAPARSSFQGPAGQGRPGGGTAERSFTPEPVSHFEDRRPPVGTFEVERHGPPAPLAWQGGTGGLVSSRSRAGDPGLSSRIAQLESQLRRLLACPLASLDDADSAPAGPGVLLLSDSDQVTHYYVEACQTLRIGIGNLLRGGRGSKGGAQLKPSLAEHLGINESKVAKYMKDHCAVRWIQLDEGAAELAHFATAVLRPVVAE
jgi:hypothetical protein